MIAAVGVSQFTPSKGPVRFNRTVVFTELRQAFNQLLQQQPGETVKFHVCTFNSVITKVFVLLTSLHPNLCFFHAFDVPARPLYIRAAIGAASGDVTAVKRQNFKVRLQGLARQYIRSLIHLTEPRTLSEDRLSVDPGSQQSESDSADLEQEVLDLATDASKPKSSGRTWTQAEVDSYVANLQNQSGGGALRASSGSEVDLTETPRQTVTPTQITPTQVNRTHTHTHTHTQL